MNKSLTSRSYWTFAADRAAIFADGNVRQALLDAKGLVQRNTRLRAA
jgi:hypothetical protein